MKNIVPTNLNEAKASIDSWRDTFSSTFKQLVEKGKELQKVTEQIFVPQIDKNFPNMDMVESADELYIVFEIPGIGKDDFELELTEGLLFLRGEKKNPLQNRAGGIHLTECTYGKFDRTVSLPCKILEDKTEANFKDGVLTIKLPKVDSPPAQRIKVEIK